MKQVVGVRLAANQERLSLAQARHRELDAQLREFGRRAYLTPNEQREVTDIKKLKLKTKDEIAMIQRTLYDDRPRLST